MSRLGGKTIVVTGGSSGIGRAMTLAFAREGAHVVIADVRHDPREGGRPTAELVCERGGRASSSGRTCRAGATSTSSSRQRSARPGGST